MLLKSLKVKDFRQFKGEQTVSFSTDPERNVTIIMGGNGSGKTTLAQVFTWCLYGDTTFEDKDLLCKAVAQEMHVNDVVTVQAELTLEHSKTEYTIFSEQRYRKDNTRKIRSEGQRKFEITFKKPDGSTDYIKSGDTELRMKEILPKELSKYFFFDGERIGNMSKEIRRGKSSEFAEAVRSLLGLSAFTSALKHLKDRGRANVMAVYNESYDTRTNSRIAAYVQQIKQYGEEIDKIEDSLTSIDAEESIAQDTVSNLTERIAANQDSEKLAAEKERLLKKRQTLIDNRAAKTISLIKSFSLGAHSYFAMKMMHDALQALSTADKLDKDIPFINDKTIKHLIDQHRCICGTEIEVGNSAFEALTRLLEYIPPKSIGNLIDEFVKECELKSKGSENFFDSFCERYAPIRSFENDYAEVEDEIAKIEKKLEGLESVGELQAKLSRYERQLRTLRSERDKLNQRKGSLITQRDRAETEQQNLANQDENNRKIETYKAYAQYMFDSLSTEYAEKEEAMRTELERTVNEIFRKIYNGGFSLSLDEKYNIQVNVIDHQGYAEDVETSTAQSISIIFAFISGVIKMARNSQKPDNELLVSEPYPLVMDAPLSAFDKARIQTVCDVLPTVAEQVIVFIKDTDGEIAEEHLGLKVGQRYTFEKENEFETYMG